MHSLYASYLISNLCDRNTSEKEENRTTESKISSKCNLPSHEFCKTLVCAKPKHHYCPWTFQCSTCSELLHAWSGMWYHLWHAHSKCLHGQAMSGNVISKHCYCSTYLSSNKIINCILFLENRKWSAYLRKTTIHQTVWQSWWEWNISFIQQKTTVMAGLEIISDLSGNQTTVSLCTQMCLVLQRMLNKCAMGKKMKTIYYWST